MTTEEFKAFCDEEFAKRDFHKKQKRSKMYYLNGKTGVLCGIFLQRSNYGAAYYINFRFYLDFYGDPKEYPGESDEFDLSSRFRVLSKDTIKGEHFLTGLIDYRLYSKEELLHYFEKDFSEVILPPLLIDKTCLLSHCEVKGSEKFPRLRPYSSLESVLKKITKTGDGFAASVKNI